MEKNQVTKFYRNLGFAFLASFSLCFLLLSFYRSGIINDDGTTFFLKHCQKAINVPKLNIQKATPPLGSMRSKSDPCSGRYIYMHDLPGRFNTDLVKKCHLLTRGTDYDSNMCPYIDNFGFGHKVENSNGVLLNHSWYRTNQYMLEYIFHNRMKQYDCITNDSSSASAIYIPYYAGLNNSQYFWNSNISVRDAPGYDFVNWVAKQPEWKRMWGRDHFFVSGRVAWDYRREYDNESYWGCKLMLLPKSQNMTLLSVESSVWNNDFAIPPPTHFHPSTDIEVLQWQERMRKQQRKYLFTFAGGPRTELESTTMRGEIINQCQASRGACKWLNCSSGASNCDDPSNVIRAYANSVFCLQPRGDAYTRRSTFDSILAGCIPVFFHPGTAYVQYLWHLPKNFTKYSVYILPEKVENERFNIEKTLRGIPQDQVDAMREEVIRLIPKVVYADPRSSLRSFEDAFDLAVKGVLERIDRVRKVIQDGGDPSVGFAEQNHFKFVLPLS